MCEGKGSDELSSSSRTSEGILDLAEIKDSIVGMMMPNASGPSLTTVQNAAGSITSISSAGGLADCSPGTGSRRSRSFETDTKEFGEVAQGAREPCAEGAAMTNLYAARLEDLMELFKVPRLTDPFD